LGEWDLTREKAVACPSGLARYTMRRVRIQSIIFIVSILLHLQSIIALGIFIASGCHTFQELAAILCEFFLKFYLFFYNRRRIWANIEAFWEKKNVYIIQKDDS